LRRSRELAAACRLPRVRWHVMVVEAALAQLAGRLDDAERLAQRAIGLLAPSFHNNAAMFFGVQSFLIRAEQGRLGELEPFVAMAAERGVTLPIWRAALAILHAALGRTDAAGQVLSDLGKVGFRDLPRDGNLLGTYANLAQVCALLEAPRFAEPLLPLLAPYADAVIVAAFTAGCLGSAARYAGLLAYTLGQLDDAVGYFATALATNQRIGAPPQPAHTQRELARTLHARGAPGDRERAAALEATAAATAARLGLVALQQRLVADAGASRTAVRVASPPGPAHRAARLHREGDVWTIACGDEIALLKDVKGLAYLLGLIRHPGHGVSALGLGRAGGRRTGR